MISLARCALALCAALVWLADPKQAHDVVALPAALALYVVYSVALWRARGFVPARAQPWIDMAFYALVVWLAGPGGALFGAFLLFAVAAAALARGFVEALALALVAALLVGARGFALDAIVLGALGTIIAWWGGHQRALTQRLELLKDLLGLPNPRFGVEHALAQYLSRLRAHVGADACVLVCAHGGAAGYVVYSVDASRSPSQGPQPLTPEAARALLALPADAALVWDAGERADGAHAQACEGLANLLETECFATVPYAQPGAMSGAARGRLFVASGRRLFGPRSLELLRQAAAQIAASVEKLVLLEELRANAAQGERSRISHDIHDTTIQPYVGLKLALEALQRSLEPRSPVAQQVGELVEMCSAALEDVRGYVARLRGNGHGPAGEELLDALRRQAGRYERFYGLDVEVRTQAPVRLTDRVAAEAYQITCEALSNVFRHTRARRAFVDLRCGEGSLALEIGNAPDAARPARGFVPRSIAERAAALGGAAEVRLNKAGHDVVSVTIPL
jgi:signal transduction histidine kinase